MSEQPSTTDSHADRDARIEELTEIVSAYNQVMEKLEASHEVLTGEVRRLQGELASANAALQRSKRLAALGEMAAGIAHEIRNPLASIQLYTNMLQEDLVELPASKDIADKIGTAVRGLNGIVGDVLAFSREMRLQLRDQYVVSLVQRAEEMVKAQAEEAGVCIETTIDEELIIRCDNELLYQALLNVMRNGVEAMPKGGELSIIARVEEGIVILEIQDSGEGISEEAIDRIFNPFFTTRATGTGLGLAIVHRIVDAHGGSISVVNRKGACFVLSLPIAGPQVIEAEGETADA